MDVQGFLYDCCWKDSNRRIGKTASLLRQAINHVRFYGKEVHFLVANSQHGKSVSDLLKEWEPDERNRKLIKVEVFKPKEMAGSDKPCFIDHHTFENFLLELGKEHRRLRDENSELRIKIEGRLK